MPQTFREYPIREVFLCSDNHRNLASGAERMKEGDIINVRSPHGSCGFGSMARGLWLLIEGPDTSVMDRLKDINTTETDDVGGVIYDKRRYSIPFNRLPDFIDLARVRDPGDIYQPFVGVATDTTEFLMPLPPLRVEGLVFDKVTGQYF